MRITAAIPPDDMAELDRVCRLQHVSQADAVHEALRFYIDREGDLPTIDYGDDPDLT
ncbi:MAG: CopG family transcriptional regulator [Alphaproteobacteria bacterium]|nr:CopG family transcriptional regulator [Alphaproteobacteria bacterium]